MARRGENKKPCAFCGRLSNGCCEIPEGDTAGDAVKRERRRIILWLEARAKLVPSPLSDELNSLASKVSSAEHCNRQG